MHSLRYVCLCIHVELSKLHIALFCAGFPVLCCDAYSISLQKTNRRLSALVMESWPQNTSPCQGKT